VMSAISSYLSGQKPIDRSRIERAQWLPGRNSI
jgi:hypothetical protein